MAAKLGWKLQYNYKNRDWVDSCGEVYKTRARARACVKRMRDFPGSFPYRAVKVEAENP